MSVRKTFDMSVVTLGAAVGVVSAVGLFFTLSAVAKPAQFKARMTALEAQADLIDRLNKAPGDARAYSAQAVCPSASPEAIEALRQRFSTEAGRASVALSNNVVSPEEAASTDAQLTPLVFEIEGEGAYGGVIGLLSGLAKSQPEVFIDTLDLKSKTATVTLKLSGHMFCWTSAHP